MAKNDNAKSDKGAKKDNKFVLFFKRIGSGCKGIISELKKVSWPTFGKVMAQTGVVLVVVLFFLVVIGAFDAGLTALFKLLTGGQSA
jgi:preprotein translocase subunit SecE